MSEKSDEEKYSKIEMSTVLIELGLNDVLEKIRESMRKRGALHETKGNRATGKNEVD